MLFRSPAAVEKALTYCEAHRMPIVVCTTGLSEELQLKVVQLSRIVPVFKSANMSIGINLLSELCKRASAGRVHGAAAICFAWCAARGLPLRADTHADNKVMQHLLEKNGFVRCGNITLADGTSRIAYHCTVPPRGGKQQTAAQAAAALAQAAKALPKPADGPLLVALDGRCAAGKIGRAHV